MNWFDAVKVLENGGKIVSTRLPAGTYIISSPSSEGGFRLVHEDGSSEPWGPSGSDQLAENWEIKDD